MPPLIADFTAESSQMPRNSALLYPNKKPKDANSPEYIGIMKTREGALFWVGAWRGLVNGQETIKIKLMPK